ncbi:MAG TPA: hypothetical protein PKD12_07310 [Nitrospira sp.]|nr:hypothetical protein [Nitrospira sp.]
MLQIISEKNSGSVRLKLEGKLIGAWTNVLEYEWHTTQQSGTVPFDTDLTGVTYRGEDGKVLLHRMWRAGARLIATWCCTGHLVEEIMHAPPHVSSV